jgi:hypothetical protein
MGQHPMFYPMGILALLTVIVFLQIPVRRFAAGRRGAVKFADFRFGESAAVPGEVSIPNRNYMNLLEFPVLFYVGALMFDVAGKVDWISLTLAWCYVGCRAVHSVIHLTYNDVSHRLAAFTTSNVVLILFWIVLFAL